jgi:hypothetical protein
MGKLLRRKLLERLFCLLAARVESSDDDACMLVGNGDAASVPDSPLRDRLPPNNLRNVPNEPDGLVS